MPPHTGVAAAQFTVLVQVAWPALVAEVMPAKVGGRVHTPVAVAEASLELGDSAHSTARTT